MICRQDLVAKNQHLDSVFPRISEGTQYTFILDKVHRWANRSEAQLTGYIWEEREVTFFDTLYSKYRCFYAAGQTYEVILSGLAFVCKIIEQPEQMDITNPELVAVYKNMGVLTIKDEKTYINTKNSAAFIPTAEQYDRDEYYFRAPVKSISEESIFGSVIYKIRATVARTYDAHTDIDLDIFVHPRVLKDGKVPKVGDDIEGTLWLQGYVWCLNDHRNAAKKFKEAVLKR
jgi:hypothetical protein